MTDILLLLRPPMVRATMREIERPGSGRANAG